MAPGQVTDDYYEILGVLQSAGKDAIRASYKRLALLHHPDKNLDNPKATAQFQLIESAYSTLFDPDRRRIYDAQYASIRAQRANTAGASSQSNPSQRTSDPKSENSQKFNEQMEVLSAALQQLYTRRNRLESELFEIKRECNRSQAALDKLQSEADKDALEQARQKSWFGYFFSAPQSEGDKEERQRRMLNNRAARTVREAEISSRKRIMASKQLSIDALNEQIRQKNVDKEILQQRERAREEAVRRAEEVRQREAMRREMERQERERQERERQEWERQEWERQKKERLEKERLEKEKRENERRENERLEQVQRALREMAERLRKDQEPQQFRNRPQPGKAEKGRQKKERLEKERLEKEKREDERREIERLEQVQRALREMAERLRKEQEPQQFRNRPQPGKAEKERQTNANANANANTNANANSKRKRNKTKSERTNPGQSTGATTSKTACLHKCWWDREEGNHVCERCLKTTSRFAFRCRSCRTVACAKCRDVMKSKKQMPRGPPQRDWDWD